MNATALVIDDEPSIRMATGAFFQKRGYGVIEAANGAKGIAALLAHQHMLEVIILDLIMPEVDGFSFLTTVDAMKHAGVLKRMPRIIVLTVIDNYHELKRLTTFESLYAVLRKPFNPSELECHLPHHQGIVAV